MVFTKLLTLAATHFNIFHAQDLEVSIVSIRDAKRSFVPSHVMTHLKTIIDTLLGVVKPTPDKTWEITLMSQAILTEGPASVEQKLVSLHATVPLCLFWLRPITRPETSR